MAQYIDKSAVVAEINRILNSYTPNEITSGRYALASLRDFLDTFEVKEVNLDEIIEQTYFDGSVTDTDDIDHVSYESIAKYFFELGVKVQKEIKKKNTIFLIHQLEIWKKLHQE